MTFRRRKESCGCKHSWKGMEKACVGWGGGSSLWEPSLAGDSRYGAQLLHPWPLHPLAVLGGNPHSHPHLGQPGLVEGVPLVE